MGHLITKEHAGKVYEWDGVEWAGQYDRTVPPMNVSSALDRLLTPDEWATIGKIPPWGTDEQKEAWHKELAKQSGFACEHRFCRGCGKFFPSPIYPMTCKCRAVSLLKRRNCEFCGAAVAGDSTCSYCNRQGDR